MGRRARAQASPGSPPATGSEAAPRTPPPQQNCPVERLRPADFDYLDALFPGWYRHPGESGNSMFQPYPGTQPGNGDGPQTLTGEGRARIAQAAERYHQVIARAPARESSQDPPGTVAENYNRLNGPFMSRPDWAAYGEFPQPRPDGTLPRPVTRAPPPPPTAVAAEAEALWPAEWRWRLLLDMEMDDAALTMEGGFWPPSTERWRRRLRRRLWASIGGGVAQEAEAEEILREAAEALLEREVAQERRAQEGDETEGARLALAEA